MRRSPQSGCSRFAPLGPSPPPRDPPSSAARAGRRGARPENGGPVDYTRPVSAAESRRISMTFGALYLITFATSIPALWLYQPVLDNPAGYVAGAGHDNRILLGAFLELLLIIANIGTATGCVPLFNT